VTQRALANLFVLFCLLTSSANANELDSALQKAQEAVDANRLEEALSWFQKATTLSPNNAELHIKVGVVAAATNHFVLALTSFEKAVANDSKNIDARFNLGKLLNAMGRHTDAVVHLNQALKGKPDDPSIRLERVAAQIALGLHKAARKELQTLTKSEPYAYKLLAFLELRTSQWKAALKASHAVLKHAPNTLSGRLLMTTALIHDGQLEEATLQLKRLIQQAPGTLANVPYSLALAAFLQGRFGAARSWMMEAQSRAPTAFDRSSATFNPQAFPTHGELAFLDWAATAPGPNRAREAIVSKLKVDGTHCHAAPIMAVLGTRTAEFQRCLTQSGPALQVQGHHRTHIRGVTITPKGAAAHCVQGLLNKQKAQLPNKARCTFTVLVSPAK
jgi:tetratricopeptide (TPR) repeat protein